MEALRPEQLERFWARVDKDGPGGCWLWTGHRTSGGYGGVALSGRSLRAHRVAYELLVGPIPEGLQLDHLCRVRLCVNPDHLEPVTQTENVRRGFGVGGINYRKTHCPQGHPLSGENLIYRTAGTGHLGRTCRICRAESKKGDAALGRALAEARSGLGLSQRELAEALGVSKTRVALSEQGRQKPSQAHIAFLGLEGEAGERG